MTATVSLAEVAATLGWHRHTARRLFSDYGGPLYRLPGTTRVYCSRAQLERFLEGDER